MKTQPWSKEQLDAAVARGPHQSAHLHTDFLTTEFSDMIQKGQWMVLPYSTVKHLPNLCISPIGVVPQRERRPWTIVDYTFFGVNADTLPLSAPEAMQFGRALERIIQNIVHADPRHGPVHLIKVDIVDGFYRIHLAPADIPTLRVSLPFS
jgi:hypothetical protein